MVRKVCKKCKVFVKEGNCPVCKGNNFTDSWKGRIYIANPEKSEIGKKIGVHTKGEYAIKVR